MWPSDREEQLWVELAVLVQSANQIHEFGLGKCSTLPDIRELPVDFLEGFTEAQLREVAEAWFSMHSLLFELVKSTLVTRDELAPWPSVLRQIVREARFLVNVFGWRLKRGLPANDNLRTV